MKTISDIKRPSKSEQLTAIQSYTSLSSVLSQLKSEDLEIEVEETSEHIKIPLKALKLLVEILKAMGEGTPISIVPIATEVTTQKAAEILGCSRPYLVKLLEEGRISYTKVGRHRRILFENVLKLQNEMKQQQKKHIMDIMSFDEEKGLYDS